MSTRSLFWAGFVVFVVAALVFDRHQPPAPPAPFQAVEFLVWATFGGFLAYTIYCSAREDVMTSMAKITELSWGRQVIADLYLGLLLAVAVVYLNEGSLLATLLWLVPMLLFVNLATLLYVALHFDQLVGRLLG